MKTKMVLPSLRGVLGDWVYYTSVMNAQQINDWILPAKDIRETESLDEILQRDLKDRKKQIANYLLRDERKFFNSIIVGIFNGVPNWVEFDLTKAQELAESKDEYNMLKDSIGLLIFNGDEEMFAIDGQHRVAGIQIANEDDNKKNKEDRILTDDQFSVIFIAHIDDQLGRKRTRKLFSDINKNAKPVAEGDKIKIDEEDINAIVTRRIYANYPHFKGGAIISLTESARLESNDNESFTNLLGLNSVNKILKKIFKKIPKTKDWDEENVVKFLAISTSFYDFIINNVGDYKSYFLDKNLTIAQTREENKYLLYRPIGLKLIAKLYVHFYNQDNGLTYLKDNINKISFIMPDSPFVKLLWNNGKMEAKSTNQSVAYNLALYLLNQQVDVNDLLKKYRELLKNDEAVLPEKIRID